MDILKQLENKRIEILEGSAKEINRLSKHIEILKTGKKDGKHNKRYIATFNIINWIIDYDDGKYELSLREENNKEISDNFMSQYNNLRESNISLVKSLSKELKRLHNIIFGLTNDILLDGNNDDFISKSKASLLVFAYIRKLCDELNIFIPTEMINLCFLYYYYVTLSFNDFEIKSTDLGYGAFGPVLLAMYGKSYKYFALKKMRKTHIVEMKQENHIKWEQKILSKIQHTFIANLFASFQDKYFLYLALQCIEGGEFFSLLKHTTLQISDCLFYASQIVLVFQYLHCKKIIYRNLKPENLLIDKNGYLHLTDFSFAKELKKPYKTWTLCGTPEYIAPELILNKGYSFELDWWTLGILIFEMFAGNPPFIHDNPMKIYQKILDGIFIYPLDKNGNHVIPNKGRDIISKLLTQNISQRLGSKNDAIDVINHSFFENINWNKILNKQIETVPWKPNLYKSIDVFQFDDFPQDSDTEYIELEHDPFENDFEYFNQDIAHF